MREKRIGRGRIVLRQGDITESETDAIVNAANNHLWMGAGVAGAIKRKGGAEIEVEETSKGPISVGEAIVTGAGALKARFVIHAAGMGQDLRTSEDLVARCTEASLRRVEEQELESVAFPAIGTGVGGLPVEAAARSMIAAAVAHLTRGESSLRRVDFVLFSEADLKVFESVLSNT